MANRGNRPDRDRDRDRENRGRNRGENFGGSRREQNFNEPERGRQFGSRNQGSQWGGAEADYSGGYNQGFGSFYSPGQGYNEQSFGGGWNQGGSEWGQRDFDRGGAQYGGGQRESGDQDWRRKQQWEGRGDTGRDFMTNQPRREAYGQMEDRNRQAGFGQRSGGDYGREPSYSEPNRDFGGRGADWGSSYGRGDIEFDSGRTSFDESSAGRPSYGSGSRGSSSYREGWRGYGSRPGNQDFGDRERPDEWNRAAYGGGSSFNRGERDFFNTDYSSTQYGGSYPRARDEGWSFDRDRGGDESFGDKVKNFFGIGPKGYKRSDDRIREDISERLEDHPQIDASNIEVTVSDGVVTLSGSVGDRRSKRLAEDVAENVRSVKDVNNQIRVQQAGAFGESGRTGSALGDLTSSSPTTTRDTGSTSQPATGATGTTTNTSAGTSKKGNERAA